MNTRLVVKLCELSKRVYDRNPVEEPVYETFFDVGETQVLVIDYFTYAIVVFRGTESLLDWKTNLGMNLTPYGTQGQVHSGFLDAIDCIKLPLIKHLRKLNKPVIITGHSLGAALGVIFTAICYNLGFKVSNLVTFGQPRVGDEIFISEVDKMTDYVRYVNKHDVIANSPPNYKYFGYVHGGKLLMFDENGYFTTPPTNCQAIKDFIKDRLKGMVPNFISHAVDQHAVEKYIENCRKILSH